MSIGYEEDNKVVRTQLTEDPGAIERDIIIGLDFGTACTKTVIGDDVLGKTYAVSFGKLAYEGHPYLIATRIFVDSDGRLDLRAGEIALDDLKYKLLSNQNELIPINRQSELEMTAFEICVGYIGLVLREIINWFLSIHGDSYRKSHLVWQLNIGMPSRSYDDHDLCKMFQRLALAGWRAAVASGPITVESVRTAIGQNTETIKNAKIDKTLDSDAKWLHPEDVSAVPEVIAEVLGYARSNLRREGTHLLVDVGAGTVDIATFILRSKDDADHFSLLTTEVENLGAFSLHRQRVVDIMDYVETEISKIQDVADGIAPIPDIVDYQPINIEALHKIDNAFRKKCEGLIGKVIHVTRIRRYPGARVWKEGLPVILCGGGSRIQLYQEAIKTAEQTSNIPIFDSLELPVPDGLDAEELTPDEYCRIAVAYGLATRQDRIGKITPPSAIKDIERPVANENWRDRYVGKEMT